MEASAPVLVLAAVERELAPLRTLLASRPAPWRRAAALDLRTSGVGKVATAIAADRAIAELAPGWVIHIGCAGAYAASGLRVGDVAIAAEEVLGDEGFETPDGFLTMDAVDLPVAVRGAERLYNRIPVSPPSTTLARELDTRFAPNLRVLVGRLLTVSTGSGTDAAAQHMVERFDPLAESMEGAASAVAAWRHGVRFSEIRGISNPVGNRRRDGWDVDRACRHAADVLLEWVDRDEANTRQRSR